MALVHLGIIMYSEYMFVRIYLHSKACGMSFSMRKPVGCTKPSPNWEGEERRKK
jgi:hypothetical protein